MLKLLHAGGLAKKSFTRWNLCKNIAAIHPRRHGISPHIKNSRRELFLKSFLFGRKFFSQNFLL